MRKGLPAPPWFAGFCARFGAYEHTPPYICINLRLSASICGFGWQGRVIVDESGGGGNFRIIYSV